MIKHLFNFELSANWLFQLFISTERFIYGYSIMEMNDMHNQDVNINRADLKKAQ